MGDLFHGHVPWAFIDLVCGVIAANCQHTFQLLTKRSFAMGNYFGHHDAISNIWHGVTVESQAVVSRVDDLVGVASVCRFVSVEPMLSAVDLRSHLSNLQWVICGGETGPGARRMEVSWAIDLGLQCADAGVPFFFKSWGAARNPKILTPMMAHIEDLKQFPVAGIDRRNG